MNKLFYKLNYILKILVFYNQSILFHSCAHCFKIWNFVFICSVTLINQSTYFSDEDECLLYSPCLNGAQCLNLAGSFQCRCQPGWDGPHCGIGTVEIILHFLFIFLLSIIFTNFYSNIQSININGLNKKKRMLVLSFSCLFSEAGHISSSFHSYFVNRY